VQSRFKWRVSWITRSSMHMRTPTEGASWPSTPQSRCFPPPTPNPTHRHTTLAPHHSCVSPRRVGEPHASTSWRHTQTIIDRYDTAHAKLAPAIVHACRVHPQPPLVEYGVGTCNHDLETLSIPVTAHSAALTPSLLLRLAPVVSSCNMLRSFLPLNTPALLIAMHV
jgi:hypothetical protein